MNCGQVRARRTVLANPTFWQKPRPRGSRRLVRLVGKLVADHRPAPEGVPAGPITGARPRREAGFWPAAGQRPSGLPAGRLPESDLGSPCGWPAFLFRLQGHAQNNPGGLSGVDSISIWPPK